MASTLYLARLIVGTLFALTQLTMATYMAARLIAPGFGFSYPSWWAWFFFYLLPPLFIALGVVVTPFIMGLGFRLSELKNWSN